MISKKNPRPVRDQNMGRKQDTIRVLVPLGTKYNSGVSLLPNNIRFTHMY
ncbi:MAG TPA: hypothetical protein VKX40_07225 [Aequorivita sp.]|nr:hypothetical protein [Aequorivita sp.]